MYFFACFFFRRFPWKLPMNGPWWWKYEETEQSYLFGESFIDVYKLGTMSTFKMCKLKRRRKTLELICYSRAKSYCFIYLIEDAYFRLPPSQRQVLIKKTILSTKDSPRTSFLSAVPPIQNKFRSCFAKKTHIHNNGLFCFMLRGSFQRLV